MNKLAFELFEKMAKLSELNGQRYDKIRFFFRRYLFAADSPMFRYFVLPLIIIIFLLPILVVWYNVSFEIYTEFRIRILPENVTNPLDNVTSVVFVKKCLNKGFEDKDICLQFEEHSAGLIIVPIATMICIIIPFFLVFYISIIMWLAVTIIHSCAGVDSNFSKVCCKLQFGQEGSETACYYIDPHNLDSCSKCLSMGSQSFVYWISLMYATTFVGMLHVLFWTGFCYDFVTHECTTASVGVCNSDDPTYPNKWLIIYFLYETLGVIGIEIILLIIIGLYKLGKIIKEDARKKYTGLMDEHNDKHKLDRYDNV